MKRTQTKQRINKIINTYPERTDRIPDQDEFLFSKDVKFIFFSVSIPYKTKQKKNSNRLKEHKNQCTNRPYPYTHQSIGFVKKIKKEPTYGSFNTNLQTIGIIFSFHIHRPHLTLYYHPYHNIPYKKLPTNHTHFTWVSFRFNWEDIQFKSIRFGEVVHAVCVYLWWGVCWMCMMMMMSVGFTLQRLFFLNMADQFFFPTFPLLSLICSYCLRLREQLL